MESKNTPATASELIEGLFKLHGARLPELLQNDLVNPERNKKANELKLALFKIIEKDHGVNDANPEVAFYLRMSNVVKKYLGEPTGGN